jgi:hypothetical protein
VWWTLNALANLADAGVLTFYNLTGEEGVIAENETLYNIFNLLKDIEPVSISSEKPAIAQDPMTAVRNTKIYLKDGKGGETCFTIKDI